MLSAESVAAGEALKENCCEDLLLLQPAQHDTATLALLNDSWHDERRLCFGQAIWTCIHRGTHI